MFLDPVEDSKRTVVLQIRNTTDKKDVAIKDDIVNVISSKGYTVVRDPKKAHFMIEANIL